MCYNNLVSQTSIGESTLPLGDVRIDQFLPPVFTDEAVRVQAEESLGAFSAKHGELPIKLRIEQFCFNGPEQVCTVDSPNKYLAWAAGNQALSRSIVNSLKAPDLPVVFRSHPLEFGIQSPTMQVTTMDQLEQDGQASILENQFFDRIDNNRTVLQLLKNPYHQSGLFLCRPTFVYDESLRDELQTFQDRDPQSRYVLEAPAGTPPELAGIRVHSLVDFAREKKERLGTWFAHNPEAGTFEARAGAPLAAQWQLDGEFDLDNRYILGRTVELASGETALHRSDGKQINSPNSIIISPYDVAFLRGVLGWQLPRIVDFERKIQEQDWIPQGLTNTHQFVILPPQELHAPQINTQYFDFHPHASVSEMDTLTGRDDGFAQLSTAEKLARFY